MELMKEAWPYLLSFLFVTALPAALALGVRWLNAKVDLFVAEKQQSKGALLLQWLAYLAGNVVLDVENTLRPHVKSALADGQLTKEEGEMLRKAALDRLKAIVGEKGKAEIYKLLGVLDLDVFLGSLIEKAVAASKPPPQVAALNEAVSTLKAGIAAASP